MKIAKFNTCKVIVIPKSQKNVPVNNSHLKVDLITSKAEQLHVHADVGVWAGEYGNVHRGSHRIFRWGGGGGGGGDTSQNFDVV